MGTLKSKGEIERLYGYLPIMEGILPQADAKRKDVKLSTKIRVADKETLFIIPEFAVGHMLTRTTDNRYVGHVNTSAYALDANKNIIKKVIWTNEKPFEFLKSVITNDGKTEMLLLVLEIDLYHIIPNWEEKGLRSEFGHFYRKEYEISIFKPPESGFTNLVANSDLGKNVIINPEMTTKLFISAARGQVDAKSFFDEITKSIQNLEDSIGAEVWEQLYIHQKTKLIMPFNNTLLHITRGSGGFYLQLLSGSRHVALKGFSHDCHTLGLVYMNCSVRQTKQMMDDVINNWHKLNT